MPNTAAPGQGTSRLQTLMSFLNEDPDNLPLLVDAAEQALLEDQTELANDLIGRYTHLAPLDAEGIDRLGQTAMKQRCFGLAAQLYEAALSEEPAPASSLKYNLAYSHAMQGEFHRATELLDEETTTQVPQAAALLVQILHDQGQFEEALDKGQGYLQTFPDHEGLNAAMSVLALDLEDTGLARQTASRSGQRPEALTTLGTLALGESDTDSAFGYFEQAISINPHGARSWIGRGLARLSLGDPSSAATDIDHGAELFDDHIGSWIAAGWAHFVSGDLNKSRERFQRAFEIDHAFAESLGSLAVIDVMEGNIAEAEQKSLKALRLDRECFSATLAQTLLLAGAGQDENARRLFEKALTTPIGKDQLMIADVIRKLAV